MRIRPCPRCGAIGEHPVYLAYHSHYKLKRGQMAPAVRRKQRKGSFCDRYGAAYYDLKTPEEKVERTSSWLCVC